MAKPMGIRDKAHAQEILDRHRKLVEIALDNFKRDTTTKAATIGILYGLFEVIGEMENYLVSDE